MFFVTTNIYNKKTKGHNLMQLFTATGKLKKFFIQLEMFDVCTTGDRHTSIQYSSSYYTRVVSVFAISPVVHTSNVSSCQKKLFQFSCGCEQFN
jgi:hypothetical protein